MVTINYSVNNFIKVNLSIIDVNGNVIETLVNEKLPPSDYELVWDASEYPSGIYFIKYQTLGFQEIQKITLLK